MIRSGIGTFLAGSRCRRQFDVPAAAATRAYPAGAHLTGAHLIGAHLIGAGTQKGVAYSHLGPDKGFRDENDVILWMDKSASLTFY